MLYCRTGFFVCIDCRNEFFIPEDLGEEDGGKLWEEWDFDPSDGSEPLPVCNSCLRQEKHLERIRRDREDMEYVLNEVESKYDAYDERGEY